MNKQEFAQHIVDNHSCNLRAAQKIIDIFTSSVISSLGEGDCIWKWDRI